MGPKNGQSAEGQKWRPHHIYSLLLVPPTQWEFLDLAACTKEAYQYSSENRVTGVYCVPKNALLWGW